MWKGGGRSVLSAHPWNGVPNKAISPAYRPIQPSNFCVKFSEPALVSS